MIDVLTQKTHSDLYRLSPLFRIRFDNGLVCDLPLTGKQAALCGDEVRAIACLTTPGSRETLITHVADSLKTPPLEASELVDSLITSQILVLLEGISDQLLADIEHWVDRGWTDALFLHLQTRSLPYVDLDGRQGDVDVRARYASEIIVPPLWKDHGSQAAIALPATEAFPLSATLSFVLETRRTSSNWRRKPMRLADLSKILEHGNEDLVAVRRRVEANTSDPTSALDSAFTALETAVFVFDVEGLEEGLYWYDPRQHALVLERKGDLRDRLSVMCIGQPQPRNAACALVVCSVWERYSTRYQHPRAYLNLMVNVAELAHKYILAATALRYSNWLTPAIRDEIAEEIFSVDMFDEAPLYVVALG